MRISKWGSVFFAFGVILSGLAIAAPLAVEAKIEDFLSEFKSTLPQGSELSYEGMEYRPLKDELFFKEAQIKWLSGQEVTDSGFADGELTLRGLTVRENSRGVENWISASDVESSSVTFDLVWDRIDFNSIAPEFGLVGAKGGMSEVKMPNMNSLEGVSVAEIIMDHLSVESLTVENTKLSYRKTLAEVGPVAVDGQTDQMVMKNYSSGILGELKVNDFKIKTTAQNKFGDEIDLELKSNSSKFQNLNISPIFKNLVVKDYDYADLWQSDMGTFEEFKSLLLELDSTQSDLSEFDGMQSQDIQLDVVFGDVHTKVTVANATMLKSDDLTSDGLSIEGIVSKTIFKNDAGEAINTTFDEFYSQKIDMSQMPFHFEKLLREGALAMEQRIQREGFLSMVPSMYLEEIGFKNAHIDIQGVKNEFVKINEFKIYDIKVDDDKNLSFGTSVDGIATKKNTIKSLSPDLYALLGTIKGDHVLLSANLDVDQLTPQNQIRLNDFSLNIEELGGVLFMADLGNLNLNDFETFEPMSGKLNSLAFHVKDRGVVEAGKLILALAQEWPVEQADGLIVGIVSSQRREGQSARTNKFFDSLEAILTSAGDFYIKGNPESPVEFVNVMGLLGAFDIDGLVNKLELESEYSPLSAN